MAAAECVLVQVVLWMHLAVEPIALIGWVILSSTEGTAGEQELLLTYY